jgi:hypothetical protein
MTAYTIKVSQRVFYDVEVEAHSRLEALREVASAIDGRDIATPDLGDYPMTETDSGAWEIEPVQVDETGGPVTDEAFLSELVCLIKQSD